MLNTIKFQIRKIDKFIDLWKNGKPYEKITQSVCIVINKNIWKIFLHHINKLKNFNQKKKQNKRDHCLPNKLILTKLKIFRLVINFCVFFHLPELSFPFSGLPLEYIVASLPSKINLNQPLEPFDNSKAAESDQTYKQSRPRQILHSRQLYALPGNISLASSIAANSSIA